MSPFLTRCLTFSRAFSRPALLAAALCGSCITASADEATIAVGPSGEASVSRWQGRLGLANPAGFQGSTGRAGFDSDVLGARSSLSLLGDYYFGQHGLSARDSYGGGFRATGGLFVGSRSNLWLATPSTLSALSTGVVAQRRGFGLLAPATQAGADAVDGGSVPYVGVGYTGLKSLRATGGGWGFSADVGLMALQPRSLVRLGPQGAGDLQLSPLLQLGVSYSF